VKYDFAETVPVRGRLWEASATVRAIRGCPEPIPSDFSARAPSGQDYRDLYLAPQGISPRTICPPDRTTGKLYFDVIGQDPDGVVYRAGGRDLLFWTR
jgi:Domain of unknown function (DUF1942)